MIKRFKHFVENDWRDDDVFTSPWIPRFCWAWIAVSVAVVILPAVFKILTR